MKLSYLIDGIAENSQEVNGVSADSRGVKNGEAFFCIRGTKTNGAGYIDEAIKNGATVIVSDEKLPTTPSVVRSVTVKNVRSAYAVACSRMYGEPSRKMKMIGVTGTNGKTTVCSMIESALLAAGKKCAVIGTLGARFEGKFTSLSTMTTPDPEVLYALLYEYSNKGAEYVVMEASSHSLAQSKLDGIYFDVGAITNVSAEHLDYHKNMQDYCIAKQSLFERSRGGVFLCDDFYTTEMYNCAKGKKIACSVKDKRYQIHAERVGFDFENGCILTVKDGTETVTLHSPIPASFTPSNVMLAYAVLKTLGIKNEHIHNGIASLKCVQGRMERVTTGRDFSVFIDFAHTPDALSRLLSGIKLMKRQGQRIVTLFGCGGDRDKTKRSLMGAIASRLSDFVIITSDNSRSEEPQDIIDEIMGGFDKSCPHVRIDDRRQAIEYAVLNAESGDIILLCGKGHECYEITKCGKRDFCERKIVTEALRKRKRIEEGK